MKKNVIRYQIFFVLILMIQEVFNSYYSFVIQLLMCMSVILLLITICIYLFKYKEVSNNYYTEHYITKKIRVYNAYFLFCALFFLLSYTANKRHLDFFSIKSIYDFLLIISFFLLVRIKAVYNNKLD